MLLHHHYSSPISLFALKCYTFFLLLPANTCRFHLTVSGSSAALLLELQLQPLLPREPKHTVLGEEGYSTSSSQILSRGFLFPDRRRRRTNSAEYSSITENELCMELAKYSTLPVSLSCSHSGTVCSCRLRPYSAIDAKELAGLVWSSSLLCSLSCRRSAHKHQRVTWLEL